MPGPSTTPRPASRSLLAPEHEKKFVFLLMRVPDQLVAAFGELDQLTVRLGNDLRRLLLVKERELFGNTNFVHDLTSSSYSQIT